MKNQGYRCSIAKSQASYRLIDYVMSMRAFVFLTGMIGLVLGIAFLLPPPSIIAGAIITAIGLAATLVGAALDYPDSTDRVAATRAVIDTSKVKVSLTAKILPFTPERQREKVVTRYGRDDRAVVETEQRN